MLIEQRNRVIAEQVRTRVVGRVTTEQRSDSRHAATLLRDKRLGVGEQAFAEYRHSVERRGRVCRRDADRLWSRRVTMLNPNNFPPNSAPPRAWGSILTEDLRL